MNELNRDDSEILDRYLQDLDTLLKGESISFKISLFAEIKNHIIDFKQEKGLTMEKVLLHFNDKLGLVNYFMMKKNLPLIKIKAKKSKLKYFFMIVLIMFTVAVIFLAITIKSFLPIFDFNEAESTLTLFGKKMVLERTGVTFNQRFGQVQRNDFPYEIKGEISSNNFNELFLTGEIINFAFLSTQENNLKYDCYSTQSTPRPVTKEGDSLNIKFVGETKCMIYLPEGITLNGNMEQGYVDLKNMRQNFKITLEHGIVHWRQDSFELFNLDVKITDGEVLGDVNKVKNQQATYSGKITIEKGKLQLR